MSAAPSQSARLLLVRQSDAAWSGVVRPWLESGRGRLQRAHVIVPTRGQAHGLKQRCIAEKIPLLGVDFLSPGLARKKWLALSEGDSAPRPAIGRELLLLGLRALIARRLAPLHAGDEDRGLWKSLQSDPERALDDFDDLLKAGFTADDFPLAPLRDIFIELSDWVERRGYVFAPAQAMAAALQPAPAKAPRIGGRVLIYGLGVELWGEFFNVAAFARRCDDLTVVLPAPEFRGRDGLDERWVDLWEKVLGVPAETPDLPASPRDCSAVGALWLRDGGSADCARLLVGRTRGDEMRIVAATIRRMLAEGATNIGVMFPRSDAAHLRLAGLLSRAGVDFVDLLETAGPPPVDVQVQRALLAFYERGGRIEEFLALWPWLRALGQVTQPPAVARDVCERCFDESQSHQLAINLPRMQAASRPERVEVARVADLLLPVWPAELTLAEALRRFEALNERFELETPPGWSTLGAFAAKADESYPVGVVLAALESFLPESSPVPDAPGRGRFARVTLTTRRRASGLTWSHVIWVEANAGVWPERREPSCWLTDGDREQLSRLGRLPLGLFTAEQRGFLEKQGCAALAADTIEQTVFTAALHDEEEPELPLAPNAWMERVLWAGGAAGREGGLERAFLDAVAEPSNEARPSSERDEVADTAAWLAVWNGRRDPARPFDDYFFAADPALVAKPVRTLSARLIERAVVDPAELWFDSVLGVKRVGWEPLVRSRAKALGQRVHRLLAVALRPAAVSADGFGLMPGRDIAGRSLEEALQAQRALWPDDAYGDSFHRELCALTRDLLSAVYALEFGPWVATELKLPPGAKLALSGRDEPLPVAGRMDLVLSDRETWAGATVRVIDFKTGGDAKLSAARMGRSGDSLQLGVYLGAVASLGVKDGVVLMLKPQADASSALGLGELPPALALTGRLGRMLASGVVGALTPDRSAYSMGGCDWPLACTPVPEATLRSKFALTHRDDAINDEAEGGNHE